MKQFTQIATCIFLIWLAAIPSCKKDDEVTAEENKAPIARAGADSSLTFASCDDKGSVTLDGSASTDPDNNIVSYRWVRLYGPENVSILTPTSAKTQVENISVGNYIFLLSVQDAKGRVAIDSVFISAKGPAQDYDLDITLSSTYVFTDNFADCYYSPCLYYDKTQINGIATFAPLGEMSVYVYETGDTATLGDAHSTYLAIYQAPENLKSVGGQCSVNFKKLISDGGGAFNGTFKAEYGSAQICGDNALDNLPLLNVSGSLHVATRMITLKINGKVYM